MDQKLTSISEKSLIESVLNFDSSNEDALTFVKKTLSVQLNACYHDLIFNDKDPGINDSPYKASRKPFNFLGHINLEVATLPCLYQLNHLLNKPRKDPSDILDLLKDLYQFFSVFNVEQARVSPFVFRQTCRNITRFSAQEPRVNSALLKILKIGIDRIDLTANPSEGKKLTPLHATFVEVAYLHPKIASSILYEDYFLPDARLGTTMATICSYYDKGSQIFTRLGDFNKASEFLTIALATDSRKGQPEMFERLLLVSLLTTYPGHDLSRHIPSSVFKANKSAMASYPRLISVFEHSKDVGKVLKQLGLLLRRGFKLEVLALVRALRERRFKYLQTIYLSVESSYIHRSDTDLKHFKLQQIRQECSDFEPPSDDVWSSNAGPTEAQEAKLTQEYIFYLIMTGAVNGSIEEETGKNQAYTVSFSRAPQHPKTRKHLGLEDQISQLHERLGEVTKVSKIMDSAGRNIVRTERFKAANNSTTVPTSMSSKAMNFYDRVDDQDFSSSSEMIVGSQQGQSNRGFDFFDRRRSFQQMADDSQDVAESESSGNDTLDEIDEEL